MAARTKVDIDLLRVCFTTLATRAAHIEMKRNDIISCLEMNAIMDGGE
jgi:hypothetical protein